MLFEDNETVALTLFSHPGDWYMVGGGPAERTRVLTQTAHRIRRGLIEAFRAYTGGRFEAVMSTDTTRRDRLYPVELYARWAPYTKDDQ